jgi:site-specific DNA recombinase
VSEKHSTNGNGKQGRKFSAPDYNISDGQQEDDGLIPAVGYCRMSDDDQEGSIEQQQAEIIAWAKGKYRILRWYIDSGKSGSKDQEKRVDFRRMLLDSSKGDFKAVLCWKTNRFGRLDSLEGADAKKTLRKAGVYLDTVKNGRVDWGTMAGRIVDAVNAEMDHEYSRSLSSDSLRGRLKALEEGFWPNGSVPYGYQRLYIAPDGREMLMPRTVAFRKPKKWVLKLVVCEEEAAIVRWIFEQVIDKDAPVRAIVCELNRRGVPSPVALGRGSGRLWNATVVAGRKGILTNPAYAGFGYCGAGRASKRGAFNLAENVRKAGVCPVIIDPERFERAQAILARREGEWLHPGQASGALTGILHCAHCRRKMTILRRRGRTVYRCASPSRYPGSTHCRNWSVDEEELLPRVCGRLVEIVDGELLKALQAAPPSERLADLEMVRQQVADLQRQVEQGAARYLKAPVPMLPDLERALDALRLELAEHEEKFQRLAAQNNDGAVANFAKWWEGVRGQLLLVRVAGEEKEADAAARCWWNGIRDTADGELRPVAGQVEGAEMVLVEPAALRSLLVRLGVKVDCFFKATGSKKKMTPGRGKGASWVLQRAVMRRKGQDAEKDAEETVSG